MERNQEAACKLVKRVVRLFWTATAKGGISLDGQNSNILGDQTGMQTA